MLAVCPPIIIWSSNYDFNCYVVFVVFVCFLCVYVFFVQCCDVMYFLSRIIAHKYHTDLHGSSIERIK